MQTLNSLKQCNLLIFEDTLNLIPITLAGIQQNLTDCGIKTLVTDHDSYFLTDFLTLLCDKNYSTFLISSLLCTLGELGGAHRWAWPHSQLRLLLEVLLQVLQPVEVALLLPHDHLLLMLHHDVLGLHLCRHSISAHLVFDPDVPLLGCEHRPLGQVVVHDAEGSRRSIHRIMQQLFCSIQEMILFVKVPVSFQSDLYSYKSIVLFSITYF